MLACDVTCHNYAHVSTAPGQSNIVRLKNPNLWPYGFAPHIYAHVILISLNERHTQQSGRSGQARGSICPVEGPILFQSCDTSQSLSRFQVCGGHRVNNLFRNCSYRLRKRSYTSVSATGSNSARSNSFKLSKSTIRRNVESGSIPSVRNMSS